MTAMGARLLASKPKLQTKADALWAPPRCFIFIRIVSLTLIFCIFQHTVAANDGLCSVTVVVSGVRYRRRSPKVNVTIVTIMLRTDGAAVTLDSNVRKVVSRDLDL